MPPRQPNKTLAKDTDEDDDDDQFASDVEADLEEDEAVTEEESTISTLASPYPMHS